jgi:hypothetical protein
MTPNTETHYGQAILHGVVDFFPLKIWNTAGLRQVEDIIPLQVAGNPVLKQRQLGAGAKISSLPSRHISAKIQ